MKKESIVLSDTFIRAVPTSIWDFASTGKLVNSSTSFASSAGTICMDSVRKALSAPTTIPKSSFKRISRAPKSYLSNFLKTSHSIISATTVHRSVIRSASAPNEWK